MPPKRSAARVPGRLVRAYSTAFRRDEAPICEGGIWLNGRTNGLDWTDVLVRNGVAIGAESRTDMTAGIANPAPDSDPTWIYDDPTAVLAGEWGIDQYAAGTVFSRNQTERCYQEVELRLRSTISPNRCTGYEIFWRCLGTENAYVEIVRWNGPLGDFTSLCKHSGARYGVSDGDEVEATIVGNEIAGYRNGKKVISITDDTFAGGSPGIGFNFGTGRTNIDYGFTLFEARSYAR